MEQEKIEREKMAAQIAKGASTSTSVPQNQAQPPPLLGQPPYQGAPAVGTIG
jgi:hypothetical protein